MTYTEILTVASLMDVARINSILDMQSDCRIANKKFQEAQNGNS